MLNPNEKIDSWDIEDTRTEPETKIFIQCAYCGRDIEYEDSIRHCDCFDSEICPDCSKVCAECGHEGCVKCMYENEDGDWYCHDDCEQKYQVKQITREIESKLQKIISGTYSRIGKMALLSKYGTELEFISGKNMPKITVIIEEPEGK